MPTPSLRPLALRASSPAPRLVASAALTLCCFAPHASAQQPGQGAPEGSTWGIGVGLISTQKPYIGVDRENTLLPMIQFENRYVRVFGPTVEVKLPGLKLDGSQHLDFRLVGQMNLDGAGYEADDAPILAGMAERKGGFWAGAKVKWHNGLADVNLEWLADASSYSKGQRLSLGLEKTWRLGDKLMFTPRVGLAWVDSNYVDYYFGVRTTEARAGRPAYAGRSAVIPGAGARAVYRFDAHHSVMVDARVASLGDAIKNSPLVDASTENRVLMAYIYRF